MKAIFDVGHPAHVHLFKNTIWNLIKNGWDIKIVVRPREITLNLLKIYGLEFTKLNHYDGTVKKAIGMLQIDFEYLKIARNFLPDIIVSAGSPYSAHISGILRKPHIAFIDTPAKKGSLFYFVSYALFMPFSKIICTPNPFPLTINPKKQITYNGYHELAYLHPNYFTPDATVLKQLGLNQNDKFIIMRFASWNAIHDIGQTGFKNNAERVEFVKNLKKNYKVLITSEVRIPELVEYEISIAIDKIHSLLSFATLYIGEGATMASEAGVLGVPWIFLYTKRLPYLDDQENNYGLGFTVKSASKALEISANLLKCEDLKNKWKEKRKSLLNDKIDVTDFMTKNIIDCSKNSNIEKSPSSNLQLIF